MTVCIIQGSNLREDTRIPCAIAYLFTVYLTSGYYYYYYYYLLELSFHLVTVVFTLVGK